MKPHTITKTERVNRPYLEYLLDNWDTLEFRPSVTSDEEWDSRKICKDYLDRLDKNGSKKTVYKQHGDKGRYFAVKGLSLQSMPREIRHTVSRDLYSDIDFVNCHPVLLAQYCSKHSIPCSELNKYITNRESLLKILLTENNDMTRESAKEVILSIMNGGHRAFKEVRTKPDWLLRFNYEITDILKSICDINKEAFKLQTELRQSKDKDYNHAGSFVNTILCDLENTAVQQLDKFLSDRGYSVDVLVFDGVMVLKNPNMSLTQDILDDASVFIEDVTGYKLQIIEKQMNEGFEIPKNIRIPENVLSYHGEDTSEIARYLWDNTLSHRITPCYGKLYFKSFHTNLYLQNMDTIKAEINNFVTNQDLYITDAKGDDMKLNKSISSRKDVVAQIISLASDTKHSVSNFMDTVFDNSILKLNFNNGVYDFRTKQFINDQCAVEGFFKIEYDYTNDRNPELIDEIYTRILNPMFAITNETNIEARRSKEQMRDCILYRLARSVAGYYEDKNWFRLEGLRNSGKGVLNTLLETTIGPYIATCDSGNFLFKSGSISKDAAKDNMFLYGMQLHRIINVQEFTIPPNKPMFINGSLIKSICSGGDRIEAREHYGMPVKLRCQATLIFAANEYPDISPANTMDYCTVWGMESRFIDTETFPEKDKIPGYMYYPRDNTIKDFIKRQDVGLAFLHILMDALEFPEGKRKYPETILAEQAEYDDQVGGDNTLSLLNSIIQFTNNPADYVSNADIQSKLISKNIVLGKMVLSRHLKSIGAVSIKQSGGQRGYTHIQLINST